MPYIKPEDREFLSGMSMLPVCHDVGELNYMITRMVRAFLGQAPRYHDFNEAVGVLECAKLELYRRMVAPYEDRKCKENGDVYE